MSRVKGLGLFRKLYGLLEIPSVYSFATKLLTPGSNQLNPPFFKRTFDLPGACVLDVGCGPALHTPEPEGLLVGVDVNESYIRKYTGGFLDTDARKVLVPPSGRRRLGFIVSSVDLPFGDGFFDEARTCAVFHHLTDEEVGKTLLEMKRCLRPGGRIVIVDMVWPARPWARPIAWLTMRLDRGRFVRSQEKLLGICRDACPGIWKFERFTYTYTGMEFLSLKWTKT